jgi:CRISPR-associated protein Csb2
VTVVLEIRYISGRVHGTPWGTSHNEGAIEFPPSPWRIIRALVSTWYERAPEVPEAVIRSLVEALSQTMPTYSVPPFAGSHVRHYLPESSYLRGVNTTGTAKVLDAFASVDPTQPLCVHWNIDLTDAEHQALAVLAAQLPYIGRAESLVTARLCSRNENPVAVADARTVQPGIPTNQSERPIRLLCPNESVDWDALLEVPWKLRQQGHVLPPGATQQPFTSDLPLRWTQTVKATNSEKLTNVFEWKIRGKGKIPVTASVAYCEILRSAIMRQFKDRQIDPSWAVAGKIEGEKSDRHHQHAHYLPICESGFLTGVMVWIPAGADATNSEIITSPSRLWAKDREGLADFREAQLFLQHVGSGPSTARAAFASSTMWETLTPYAPSRYIRTDGRMMRSLHEQLTRELAELGLPAPIKTDIVQGSPHALDFRRHRVKERLRESRRSLHVRLTFTAPVAGPISLGALSHFGLGHFLPSSPSTETISSFSVS